MFWEEKGEEDAEEGVERRTNEEEEKQLGWDSKGDGVEEMKWRRIGREGRGNDL